MKILILGGAGMLGHQLYKYFSKSYETKVTLNRTFNSYKGFNLFHPKDVYDNFDVLNQSAILEVITNFRPDAIINAVGLIKQRADKSDFSKNLEINAIFPHQLSLMAKMIKARVIHLSTDCVFDGKRGHYTENDLCSAEDIYGKSKFLGELHYQHTITLRTSIIGFELFHKANLLEWVLKQQGKIRGFKKAIYTGFTTFEMTRIIENILLYHPDKFGLYHVASSPISKYDLICLINEYFSLQLKIETDTEFECYRDLVADKFNHLFDYQPPTWEMMIGELYEKQAVQFCTSVLDS